MEYRKPGFTSGVEAMRGKACDIAGGHFLTILLVHIKEFYDRRVFARGIATDGTGSSQAGCQRIDNAGYAFLSEAKNIAQPPVIRRGFKIFERLYAKFVIQTLGEDSADTVH